MIKDWFFITFFYVCFFKVIFYPSDIHCFFYTGGKTYYTPIELYPIGIIRYNMPFREVEVFSFTGTVYGIYFLDVSEHFFCLINSVKSMLHVT